MEQWVHNIGRRVNLLSLSQSNADPQTQTNMDFPTLEPHGVVDKVQDICNGVILAHLHLLTLCERQQEQEDSVDKSSVFKAGGPQREIRQ